MFTLLLMSLGYFFNSVIVNYVKPAHLRFNRADPDPRPMPPETVLEIGERETNERARVPGNRKSIIDLNIPLSFTLPTARLKDWLAGPLELLGKVN